jgi:tetratricopeptide (TPR) repeat protein
VWWVLATVLTAWAANPDVEALMRAGRIDEALSAAQVEVQARPSDLPANERYIDLLHNMGRADVAIQLYKSRVEAAPADADQHYLLGRAVTRAENAQTAYENALVIAPEHARAHMGLAAVYVAGGQLGLAETEYRKALAKDQRLGEAWQGLASLLVSQRRTAEALEVAQSYVARVPEEADGWLTIATLLPAEAGATLQKGLKSAGTDPRLALRLAELSLDAGRGKEAAAYARQALSLAPGLQSAGAIVMFGDALAEGVLDDAGKRELMALRNTDGRDPQVLARYDALASKYPRSSLVWLGRSGLRLQLGDRTGAHQDLVAAGKVDPSEPEVQAALGLSLLRESLPGEALPWLQKAVAARPDDSSLQIGLGKALRATGLEDDGFRVLQRNYAAHPMDSFACLEYAAALSERREREAAYATTREGYLRIQDSRLLVAMVAAALDAGHGMEVADLLEEMGQKVGRQELIDQARALRKKLGKKPLTPANP